MAKKYHAVRVGKQPGLYTEWENGANPQITGIKGYNRAEGCLSTNSYAEAVAFLKAGPLRKVYTHYSAGQTVTFEEMTRVVPLPPDPGAAVKTPAAAPAEPDRGPCMLDAGRISHAPICGAVDRYCAEYGYERLSEDQRRAVQAVNGRYLLFAVPGSGKTTVLMARAGYMVHACGIDPRRLMTMTFTRASAAEMKKRYLEKFPDDPPERIPDFRTIHKFCMGIVIPRLRRTGFVCPHHVIDEDRDDKEKEEKEYTQRVILRDVLKACKVPKCSDESAQNAVQAAFSSFKNRALPGEELDRYSVLIDKKPYSLKQLYSVYEDKLHELDCMDYDDMLICALKGLRAKPAVLAELRGMYSYWSIDEAQDNSKVQHELLDLLAGENGNLFMVGDDDQSIYSFRGAEPRMLLEFGNRPDVTPLVMGTNYRSGARLVNTARLFIENNRNRADKQMNPFRTEGGVISVPQSFRDEAQQYAYIDSAARICGDTGKRLGVLYQLNASALPLVVHMHRSGIPFEASKGLTELLSEKTVGSLMRILKFTEAPSDLSLFRKCKRDLGLFHTDEEGEKALASAHRQRKDVPVPELILALEDRESDYRADVEKCWQVLKDARGRKPADALRVILQGIPSAGGGESLTDRLSRYALLSVCDLYDTLPAMLEDLKRMTEKEKQTHPDPENDAPADASDGMVTVEERPVVSLSTIHSAKGREWEHVILIDSFAEVFPGKLQPDRIGFDPEEPARLFYVAVTRAIERLDILTTEQYHGNREEVSGFVADYAFEADRTADTPVESVPLLSADSVSPGVLCTLPRRFYSVPAGPKPGVYTDWSEVEALLRGVSVSPAMQPKGHDTFAEAWERVFPGRPLPEDGPSLSCGTIRDVIQLSGGASFNHPLDMPAEVCRGLLDHLRTESLRVLPAERLRRIASEASFDWRRSCTDYHGRTDGYAVCYMAVNFFKPWLPLWKLLSDNRLPEKCRVLEIGPGPGTATWSLIEFYRRLAAENPARTFALDYTAVEKEQDFSGVFFRIRDRVLSALPPNLSVRLTLRSGTDAFAMLRGLSGGDIDLMLESNVLNHQEKFTAETVADYLAGLRGGLRPSGCAILIEPREPRGASRFADFIRYAAGQDRLTAYCGASDASVDVSGITLYRDALETGVRYSRRAEHWFSYAVIAKSGEERKA